MIDMLCGEGFDLFVLDAQAQSRTRFIREIDPYAASAVSDEHWDGARAQVELL